MQQVTQDERNAVVSIVSVAPGMKFSQLTTMLSEKLAIDAPRARYVVRAVLDHGGIKTDSRFLVSVK